MNDDPESSNTFCARELFLATALYDGLEDCNISHLRTILQERDANPNVILPKQGVSPLHLAIGIESEDFAEKVTRLFLQYGGNPNVRSIDRQTPVHIAAAWGRANIFDLLLLNGGDPWIHDCDGNNAFHYAYKEQHWNIVDILQRFWLKESHKDDDSSDKKYILTFEKVFVYGKNVAYEYIADSKSALCTNQVLSVSAVTSRSCNAIPQLAEYSSNHQESSGLYGNQNCIVQKKIDGGCSATTQTCQKFCLANAIPDIAVNGCAENKPCRVDTMHKSVPEEECDSDRIPAEKQAHTPEWKEENLRKRQWGGSCSSSAAVGQDTKVKLLDEMKFNNPCDSEQVLCNESASLKGVLRLPSPERSVEKSLNIINKTEHLLLKFEEGLTIENVDGFQAVKVTDAGDVSQNEMDTEIRGKPTISESDVVMFGNSYSICSSDDSACHGSVDKKTGLPDSEWNGNVKDDGITQYCDAKSKCGHDTFSTCDTFLSELILENEWIASQSCFVLSESTGYVTCDDTYPVVTRTDMAEDTNCMKSNVYNPSGKTSPNSTALVSSSLNVDSFMSLSEEYKYSDEVGGVVLLERRFLVPAVSISDPQSQRMESKFMNPLPPSTRLQEEVCDTEHSSGCDISIPPSLDYDTDTLRRELKENGYIPGPIVPTTKRLYLRKLFRIQRKPVEVSTKTKVYSPELQCTMQDFNLQKSLPDYRKLENEMTQQFSQPEPSRRWRGGIVKSSFTYLLLDPRVTKNLPCHMDSMSDYHIWSTFISSIFYIGKGMRSRPYSHLYEAFAVWKKKKTVKKTDKKVQFILDIWKAGLGVVCLHVFQNVIPVEAYTCEAAMIDAIQLRNLKNERCGDYYGIAATWTLHQKKMLGTYLLYRAMCIFIHEGERQLRPGDLG